MSKFYNLGVYVSMQKEDVFTLSFEKIESLIGSSLPASAQKYIQYWDVSPTHSIANVVFEKGYKMSPNLVKRTVTFHRVDIAYAPKRVKPERTPFYVTSYTPFKGMVLPLHEQVDKFVGLYKIDRNGRYMSFDHCREAFLKYRKDESKRDYLALHLYAYLGSWGMFRNSFLQQKDYLFNKPVVDILCKYEYEPLYSYDPFKENNKNEHRLIIKLAKEIEEYYLGHPFYDDKERKESKITNVTDTLVSKIILGSIGCTVAYDRYVKSGLRNAGLSSTICYKSLGQLDAIAKSNEKEIKEILSSLNELYTPAKVLDMYFFEKGFDLSR